MRRANAIVFVVTVAVGTTLTRPPESRGSINRGIIYAAKFWNKEGYRLGVAEEDALERVQVEVLRISRTVITDDGPALFSIGLLKWIGTLCAFALCSLCHHFKSITPRLRPYEVAASLTRRTMSFFEAHNSYCTISNGSAGGVTWDRVDEI